MKKILSTFFLTILFVQTTFAECSIKDSSADVLIDYIGNLRKVVSKITNDLGTNGVDDSTISKISTDFTRGINKIIDFDGYYSSFDFTLLQVTNEVPYQVKRDRALLKNEVNNLQKYLERIVKRGYANNLIKDVCTGIDNCNLSGNGQQVITDLIKNTSKILTLYESSILGDSTSYKNSDFILVPNNFKDELIKYYNKNTLSSCSLEEGGFWERASKAMEKISFDKKYMKDATQKWIDAWNLLTGKVSKEKERQIERDLLKKELSRQGLSENQSKIIMNNLEKFNQEGGYSAGNNFFTNSFNSMANAGGKFVSAFGNLITGLADIGSKIGSIFQSGDKGGISTQYVNNEVRKNDNTKQIFEKMQNLYSENLVYAGQQTIVDEKIVDEIIELHISLANITDVMNKTYPVGQKVCETGQCANKSGNCYDF